MQELDLKPLVLYTELPELWGLFQGIIKVNPPTELGFSLMGADIYLSGLVVPVNHSTFWRVMSYFLYRMNKEFNLKKKSHRNKK